MKILRSMGTHDGTFHADEVTACALLLLANLIDQDKIIRTRDPALLSNCEYVCDVGGIYDPEKKLFDHHQIDYTGPLSSAGMILEHLKSTNVLTTHAYEFLNRTLIQGVDAHDNGNDPQIPGVSTYSNVVSNFTPIPYNSSAEEQNTAFFEAVNFAKNHLKRLLERYNYTLSCRQILLEAMAPNEKHLLFNQPIPWLDLFFEMGGERHPALFVVMPSGIHWKLRGIPPTADNKMKVRLPLPEEWAGLPEEEFKRISGIPGAIFCHKGRFISVWETKNDALKGLELVLKKQKESK